MNFKDTLETIDLILESGAVPLLVGESGIGKTALIKTLSERHGYYNITIDGNMLKEGEIGGLPTVDEYTINIDGHERRAKRTVYAVHTKLQEIDNAILEQSERSVMLFIDEINRCEHTVQQELMNIILNREINGYKLPVNVYVVAAMNPSNKYDQYSESNYQVVDMDPAQENRFVWVLMESDAKSWLSWGIENDIHEDILNFISSFPEYLHKPHSSEMVKATPRSWERVSNAYKIYLNRKKDIPERILLNIVSGNVGISIAQEFMNFLNSRDNPIIKPQDIFYQDKLSEELIQRVRKESHSRLYMTARNILIYLKESENRERDVKLFSEFLQLYPSDLKLGIMRDIKESCQEDLYEAFLSEESFIKGFFEIYINMEGEA